MRYLALMGLAVLGSAGCGGDMEDLGVSRFAIDVATGAELKQKLTADPYGSYKLTADIDMNNTDLHITAFYGVLDGNGKTISKVKRDVGTSSGRAGLIGDLRGTVKNLKLVGFNLKAQTVGGLAASCNASTVQNVSVQNAVIEAGLNAGGICGGMSAGTMTGSSASGSVKSTGGSAGGAVGSSSLGRSGLGATITSTTVSSMTVTGITGAGGLMGYCQDVTIKSVGVDANVSGQAAAGGICAEMNGGKIDFSYAKGANVGATAGPAGGLVGRVGLGMITEPSDQVQINSCYAAYTNVNASSQAGGLVGTGVDPFLQNVYAVSNVAGTNGVGGLIGRAQVGTHGWILNAGVFRGIVNDTSRNWAGVLGRADLSSTHRWSATLFDSTLDSGPHLGEGDGQERQLPASTTELKSPTVVGGDDVYCFPDPDTTICGDGVFYADQWNAGDANQHHALIGLPGGLSAQPR